MNKMWLWLGLWLSLLSVQSLYAVSKDGITTQRLAQYPTSLNPYTGNDVYGSLIHSYTLETLTNNDDDNFKVIEGLANKWEESADHLTFTYHINPKAKFSDGKPVTAEDVKFTFDTIYDTKNILAQTTRDFIGPMKSIKIVDPQTIAITMENIHYLNLERLGGAHILPKHIYGVAGKDFNKDFEKDVVGSGPYILKPHKDKKELVLDRNEDWWGKSELKSYSEYYNFKKIVFKVVQEDNVAFEMFKKKEIDSIYFSQGLYPKWDDTKLFPWTDANCKRLESPKNYPSSWGGIALNMRKMPLIELKFRQALQFAFNRDMIIQKIFNNKEKAVIGPFMETSPYSAKLPPIPFDKKKTAELLKELGYTQVDNDGVLFKNYQKDGKDTKQRAEIELMYSYEPHGKWATVFKEDAKKLGIKINLKYVEWTSAMKQMDEFNFDMFVIGWAGDPHPGPAQIFGGETANVKGSSNFPGINNLEINALIKSSPALFDEAKRYEEFQKLEKLIIEEQPYLFRWQTKNHLVAYWADKVSPPEVPFLKYTGDENRNTFLKRWFSVESSKK